MTTNCLFINTIIVTIKSDKRTFTEMEIFPRYIIIRIKQVSKQYVLFILLT